jgi:hypothetical protein
VTGAISAGRVSTGHRHAAGSSSRGGSAARRDASIGRIDVEEAGRRTLELVDRRDRLADLDIAKASVMALKVFALD